LQNFREKVDKNYDHMVKNTSGMYSSSDVNSRNPGECSPLVPLAFQKFGG